MSEKLIIICLRIQCLILDIEYFLSDVYIAHVNKMRIIGSRFMELWNLDFAK